MGLTSALYTGLAGLNSSQFRLDTIGDNIANVNTVGFKSSRTMFQTLFSQTLSGGSAPSASLGGTNPVQIGLGSVTGSVQRNFAGGSLETTGVSSDLAIEGNGFFIVRSSANEQLFTRDGSFSLSADKRLVSQDGYILQGYGVDSNFNLVKGSTTDLTIPVGTLTTAQATTQASFDGTLDAGGTVATTGSSLLSQVLDDTTGAAITGATLLTDVRNPGALATPLLATGDTLTISGIQVGGRDVPSAVFTVGTTGTTVADFMTWLDQTLGINEDAGVAGTPGISVVGGQIQVNGNAGTDNAITIPTGTLLSSNAGTTNPFTFTSAQVADGTSTHTSFVVYDSLGNPVHVDATAVLEARSAGGTTWRLYFQSADDSDVDLDLGSTTVTFDAQGRPIAGATPTIQINRANSGAADPMVVDLDLSRMNGLATANSTLLMTLQNGFSTGTLIDYAVGTDGVITGTFSNGLTKTVGQLALGTFANPAGLVSRGNNTFSAGANSGEAQITDPQVLGAGGILGGALELSNVDLSREFINMITASTGFSAASRVISTSDQLLQDLLSVARR